MESTMTRAGLFPLAAAGATLLAIAAGAQTASPEGEDGRFTFHRTDQGYLRLDGRTGQVSRCAREQAGWLCQAVPDDRAAFEAEIARLQRDNTVLKKELLSHNLPLPRGVPAEAATPESGAESGAKTEPKTAPEAAPKNEPTLRLPSDPELNQMMSFLEKVWRRLVEMITNAQKDLMRKT
jgi:hypothetical protein